MNKILTTAYLKSNLGNEYMKSICEIYVANKKACCFIIMLVLNIFIITIIEQIVHIVCK